MKFVSTREELRAHYKAPGSKAVEKEIGALDRHCRNFIARSPFVVIGSQDDSGHADVTPKGDRPGFVAVLDDRTLAIPDRPGNNRLDTFENLLVNPAIGLIFLIPGMKETLRVNGMARITLDADLRQRFAFEGKAPMSVIVVDVKSAYMHCAMAFMRSQLWEPSTWPDRGEMPTLGEILRDHAAAGNPEETDQRLAAAYREELW